MGFDKIESLGSSLIQHGSFNNRVYLMKLDAKDMPEIIGQIGDLAEENKYGKIFAKVPAEFEADFLKSGYVREAFVPGFYNAEKGAVFLAKFSDERRKIDNRQGDIDEVLELCRKKGKANRARSYSEYSIRSAGRDDVEEMSEVYKKVFLTYPFPIHDPEYLLSTMKTNIDYFLVEHEGRIVALSSAEKDVKGGNAEMTDFATLPDHRGRGLAGWLLSEMEAAMRRLGIPTCYTIARAYSAGMNITFSRKDYEFAGTLINNTAISEGIESMNVWYKKLSLF